MLLFWFMCRSRWRTGAVAAVLPLVEASPDAMVQRPSFSVPLRASSHGSDRLRVGGGLFSELGCTFVSAGAGAARPVLHSTRTLASRVLGRARTPRLGRAPGRRAAAGRDCMSRWAVGQALSGSQGWVDVIPRCVWHV